MLVMGWILTLTVRVEGLGCGLNRSILARIEENAK